MFAFHPTKIVRECDCKLARVKILRLGALLMLWMSCTSLSALPDSLAARIQQIQDVEQRFEWYRTQSRGLIGQNPEVALELGLEWIEATAAAKPTQKGLAYNNLGILYSLSHQSQYAIGAFTTSIGWFERARDTAHQGYALRNMAVALGDLGLIDSALSTLQQSLVLLDSNRHALYYALSTQEIGKVLYEVKSFDLAIQHLALARRIMVRQERPMDQAGLLLDIALCQMELGDLGFSESVQKGLNLSKALGDSSTTARLYFVRAQHAMNIGDLGQLEQSLEATLRALNGLPDDAFKAIVLGSRAEWLRRKGQWDPAVAQAQEALRLLLQFSQLERDPWSFHQLYETLFLLHQQKGEASKALFYAVRSKESAERLLELHRNLKGQFFERELKQVQNGRNDALKRLEQNYANERLMRKSKEALGYQMVGIVLLLLVGALALQLVRYRQKQTQLLHSQLALEENERNLTQLNEEKDRIVQIIGHDLRGPLTSSIRLLTYLPSDRDVWTDENEEVVQLLRQGLLENLNLLENLLSWAKDLQDGFLLTVFRQPIQPMVERVAGLYDPLIKARKMQLNRQIDPKWEALVDRNGLETVLRNLVANAVKYCPEGSSINVSGSKTEEGVVLVVEDNGPGLPNSVLEALESAGGNPFFPHRDGRSPGLGLTLCKELLEAMNGRFSVRSAPGFGCRFELFLPA